MVAGRAHDNWMYRKRRRAHASVGSVSCRGARPNRKELQPIRVGDRGSAELAMVSLGCERWGSTGLVERGGLWGADENLVRCCMPTLAGSPVARFAGCFVVRSGHRKVRPVPRRRKKGGARKAGPATRGVVKPSRAPRLEKEGMELILCCARFSCHALRGRDLVVPEDDPRHLQIVVATVPGAGLGDERSLSRLHMRKCCTCSRDPPGDRSCGRTRSCAENRSRR